MLKRWSRAPMRCCIPGGSSELQAMLKQCPPAPEEAPAGPTLAGLGDLSGRRSSCPVFPAGAHAAHFGHSRRTEELQPPTVMCRAWHALAFHAYRRLLAQLGALLQESCLMPQHLATDPLGSKQTETPDMHSLSICILLWYTLGNVGGICKGAIIRR